MKKPDAGIETSSEEPPGVDVVIVSWNTATQAIRAARAYASSNRVNVRVLVVDNDSEPADHLILAEAAGDDFELVTSDQNLGFGGAANLGLSQGANRYVTVSNADVIPAPDALAKLVDATRRTPNAGMVGPVFEGDGNVYHDHLPGPITLLLRAAMGGFGRRAISIPASDEIARVEQPSGACFAMSRETWEGVGGFDDGFFLWYEDVDLARRLLDADKASLIVGGAVVNHAGGSSFERLGSSDQQAMRLDSLYRYIKVHHPWTARFSRPLFRTIGWLRTRKRNDRFRRS